MVWIHYSLTDGSQTDTNSKLVDPAILAAADKGTIWYDGDPTGMMVDISQNPPVVMPAPPSPYTAG